VGTDSIAGITYRSKPRVEKEIIGALLIRMQ